LAAALGRHDVSLGEDIVTECCAHEVVGDQVIECRPVVAGLGIEPLPNEIHELVGFLRVLLLGAKVRPRRQSQGSGESDDNEWSFHDESPFQFEPRNQRAGQWKRDSSLRSE